MVTILWLTVKIISLDKLQHIFMRIVTIHILFQFNFFSCCYIVISSKYGSVEMNKTHWMRDNWAELFWLGALHVVCGIAWQRFDVQISYSPITDRFLAAKRIFCDRFESYLTHSTLYYLNAIVFHTVDFVNVCIYISTMISSPLGGFLQLAVLR